ncbi:PhnD/SsuA/transferrin family substrate-binding protein [Limisalsivibrio acetivorans]|uniref:PhnD/SsuA/transferrin family substrate-binding protein n=1 Tax=Limisalsivibrio acetivorans TaxID=1304888 RepID=UPI0003B7A3E0|nr:PhnD/SsuA/transferrin family substrate-binding protein [Limisalsivibrio acetivorans]
MNHIKKINLILVTFILFIIVLSNKSYAKRIYHYAPLPTESSKSTISKNMGLIQSIRKILNAEVEIVYHKNYDNIINEFSRGNIDIAYLGPLPVIKLQQNTHTSEPVLLFKNNNGNARYRCTLCSPLDGVSDRDALRTIRPVRVALTQESSTCGPLSTFWLLRDYGIKIEDSIHDYLCSHESVALSLVRGEFDVGGIKDTTAERFKELGLNIIASTPPLPGFALVVNTGTMEAEAIDTLVNGLLKLDEDERKHWDIGRYGFEAVDNGSYDNLSFMLEMGE